MKDNDKDIYEMFNDIEFDEKYMSEIPLDDLSKKRIKDNVLKSVKRKKRSYKKIAAVAAIALVLVTAFAAPQSRKVMAALKEKIFFSAGTGLVSENEETYVLKEPISFKAGNENILIKSVYSKKDSITVGLWISDPSKKEVTKEELESGLAAHNKSDCKIKLTSGRVIESESGVSAGGGDSTFISKYFEAAGIEKEFTLLYNGYEEKITLVKAESSAKFDEIGGNATNKDLLIGSTKYNFNNKTYLSFWTDLDVKRDNNTIITFDKEDINVTGKNSGRKYDIKPSESDGHGREFYMDKIVNEPLDIAVSKVTIDYDLKDEVEMTLKLPKQGESIAVNKMVNIDAIHEKLYITSVKRTKEDVEVYIDPIKYKDDYSLVQLVSPSGSGGCIGTDGKSEIISLKGYKDISLLEKISSRYKFKIRHVMLTKTGPWKFEE